MGTMRVSKWLQLRYPLLNQRQREEALDEKLVLLPTGAPAKKGDKVSEGSELDCTKLDSFIETLKQGALIENVRVVKEEEDTIIIDKPEGLASHPIGLFDTNTVTQWMRWKYPQINQEFPEPQPTLTPHRLDQGTSGVMVVALTKASFLGWRDKFKKKMITKEYLAWCWGNPTEKEYSVDVDIAHMVGDPRKMIALKGEVKYRPPVLEAFSEVKVEKLVSKKGIFLARVECSTGVTHQVRVHLASLGFPLVGDSLYDPLHSQREIERKTHALRAVSLKAEGWGVSVSTDDFCIEY